MSHIVQIQTQVRDPVAIAAACQRLEIPAPTQRTAKLYDGQYTAGASSCLAGSIPLYATRPPANSNSTTSKVAGRAKGTRPVLASLRRGKGQTRSETAGAQRPRTTAFQRLDQVDHPSRRRCCLKNDHTRHQPHRRNPTANARLSRQQLPSGEPSLGASPCLVTHDQKTAEFFTAQEQQIDQQTRH